MCGVADRHELEGGLLTCSCRHCSGDCSCDDDFDADELGLDPEEPYDA